MGVLLQSNALDQAADNHSNYLAINNDYGALAGLVELTSAAGFVGATTTARLSLAGFTGTATEIAIGRERVAVDGVRAALASPFRRLTLLGHGITEIGLGFVEPGATRPAGTPSLVPENVFGALVATAGVRSAALPQAMQTSAAGVSVFPADNATQVPVMMYPDSPNPVAEFLGPFGTNGLYPGFPISLQVTSDKTLAVTSFSLTRVTASGNTAVLSKLLDSNDPLFMAPNNIKNWATIVPLSTLVPGATYQASLSGSAGGTSFTKTWSFTTRSGFTATAVQREGPNQVTIGYTSPSGILQTFTATYNNCGVYNATSVNVLLGSQTVTFRGNGVTPPAGCTVSLTVTDLGTPTSDTRSFAFN